MRLRRRKPNWQTLALTFESAHDVMARKSLWMVEYLRARRDGDHLLAFYRRQHFADKVRP